MESQIALFIDFENVAIWAREHHIKFDIGELMDLLEERGQVVVRKAYADWGKFPSYRASLLNNAIDLIQLYTVRAGKNRADIRMALDAFEVAVIRPQVDTIAIVSGDSDFGPLVNKLREYGKFVIGFGPRGVTHRILIAACNEFTYLATTTGAAEEEQHKLEQPHERAKPNNGSQKEARALLQRAVNLHAQREELPILATHLKQTLLSLDENFDESRLGYSQFRSWLEANRDIVSLTFNRLQMYVAPVGYKSPQEAAALAQESYSALLRKYRSVFNRIISVDLQLRREIMHDIYEELSGHPDEFTPDQLLERLKARYADDGKEAHQNELLRVWQTAFFQRAYRFPGDRASFQSPVRFIDEIQSEEDFVRRVESGFIYGVLKKGLDVDCAALAEVLVNDPTQTDYIEGLFESVQRRAHHLADWDALPFNGHGKLPEFLESEHLEVLVQDLGDGPFPHGIAVNAASAARLAQEATDARHERRFTDSIDGYLKASQIQQQALRQGQEEATVADLAWYLASYASVKAGDLSLVARDYATAQRYYLAFFYLLKVEPHLWDRVEKLTTHMVRYYWANVARQLDVEMEWAETPAQLALQIVNHDDPRLRHKWNEANQAIAHVNPELLQWLVKQIKEEQQKAAEAS